MYSDALLKLTSCVTLAISDPRLAKKAPGNCYETILSYALSEVCNDASLILSEMSRLQHKGWSDSIAWKNERSLNVAAKDTLSFAKGLLKAVKGGNKTQLAKIVERSATSILCLVHREGDGRGNGVLDLSRASQEFLKLATDIEGLLLTLLEGKERVIATEDEDLSRMLVKMKL
ncbi:hypothetical protein PT974_04940 [Cladobotryum mycophilum]|uniref:Uncharacterized protein n=1 Tax=Cladobotryum mycophilum TaxID=491253 RepID=A0ABR0SQL1_9HYPO